MAHAIAIDANGAIIVAGVHADAIEGRSSFVVARYRPDGRLDGSFNGTGTVITQFPSEASAHALAIDPDGRLAVGGGAQFREFALTRYSPGTGGQVITDLTGFETEEAYGTLMVSGAGAVGEVVVAGTARNARDGVYQNKIALVRYRDDGSFHPTFGGGAPALSPFSAAGYAIARGPLNTLLVAGEIGGGFGLARFDQFGNSDASFGKSGRVITQFPNQRFALAQGITVRCRSSRRRRSTGSWFTSTSRSGRCCSAR